MVDHIRLFRNWPDLRWSYHVHEQILPAIRRSGGDLRFVDIQIVHVGYQDPALRRRKLERDLRLLELDRAEQPDEPFTLFNLGSVYLELERMEDALACLQRSLDRSHPRDSIVRKLYALIAQCHRHLGKHQQSMSAVCAGRQHHPDDTELLFQHALLLREERDLHGAEALLLRLLEHREGEHFASVDAGLRGFKARHNLAVVYGEQGRPRDAEEQWRAALAEQPLMLPLGWAWRSNAWPPVAGTRWTRS